MIDLVSRLAAGGHRIAFRRTALELKEAIERGYVLLEFTETRGGTQLGVTLDPAACVIQAADFAAPRGNIHLEGDLELDGVPVRLHADLDLASLAGEGHLAVRGPSAGVARAETRAHAEAP